MSIYRNLQMVLSTGTFVLLMVTGGAGGIGLIGLWVVERELIGRTGESLMLGAVDVAGKLDSMLRERAGDIEILVRAPQVQSQDPVQMSAHLREVQRAYPVYARLAVVNRAGRIVASTDETWVGTHRADTGWFQSVVRFTRPHVELVTEPGRAGGALTTVQFSVPIRGRDGVLQGVILTEIDRAVWHQLVEDTVDQIAAETDHYGAVRYKVLSEDGEVLLTYDKQEIFLGNLRKVGVPSAKRVLVGQTGYIEERHHIRQVDVVTGYARMQGLRDWKDVRWGVLLRADRADVLASIRTLLVKLGMAGLAGFGLVLGALLWANAEQRKEQRRLAQAKQALIDNEAQLRAVVEMAADGIITMNDQGVILSVNPAAEIIFGYSAREVVGESVTVLMPEPFASKHAGYVSTYIRTGQKKVIGIGREVTGCRKDGSIFPLDLAVSEMRIGSSRCFTGIVRDITDRKALVAKLEEGAVYFRMLSELLPLSLFELRQDGRLVYRNRALDRLVGGAADRPVAQSWLDWINQEDRQRADEAWAFMQGTMAPIHQECRLAGSGGESRWVQLSVWPLETEHGVRYLGVMEDITARKRTAAQTMSLLQHGRFELRTLAEARNLAELLAYAFPDPARAQLGVTELLVNGVEHGNLNVSYEEKSALLKRGTLADELERRLALPEHQRKRVRVVVDRTERELELLIMDDGSGFDWEPYLADDGDRTDVSHGRGIGLSRSISFDRMEYRGSGNHVVAATRLGDADSGAEESPERRAA